MAGHNVVGLNSEQQILIKTQEKFSNWLKHRAMEQVV